MFAVDWQTGYYAELTDGVKWPNLYFAAAVGGGVIAAVGFFLSMTKFRLSKLSQLLRRRLYSVPRTDNTCWDSIVCDARTAFLNQTFSELCLVLCYPVILGVGITLSTGAYADIGKNSGYVIGHLVALHLAVTALPVTRNSVWLWWFGIDFDSAIAWHRRVARVTIVLMWAHFLSMEIIWTVSITFETKASQWGYGPAFGLFAALLFSAAGLFALPYCRRRRFSLFLIAHHALVPFGYLCAMLHSVQLCWLMIVPGSLWAIDVCIRLSAYFRIIINGPLVVCSAEPFSHSNVNVSILQLQIPRFTYTAGSHVFVKIPSVRLFEWHPFSISSSPSIPGAPFTLHILDMGDRRGGYDRWTYRLHRHLQQLKGTSRSSVLSESIRHIPPDNHPQGSVLSDSSRQIPPDNPMIMTVPFTAAAFATVAKPVVAKPVDGPVPLTVFVDGPYRAFDITPVEQFPVVVLVAGGVGITPLMSVFGRLLDLHDADAGLGVRVPNQFVRVPNRFVHLIWSHRASRALSEWFVPLLRRAASKFPHFRLHLYCTGQHHGEPAVPVVDGSSDRSVQLQVQMAEMRPADHWRRLGGNIGSDESGQVIGTIANAATVQMAETRQCGQVIGTNSARAAIAMEPTGLNTGGSSDVHVCVIEKGRPNLESLFDNIRQQCVTDCEWRTDFPRHRVAVAACGPAFMCFQAYQAAARNGFQYHEEGFRL